MKPEISPTVAKLCQAHETISSEVAKDPSLSPGEASKRLYGSCQATGKPHDEQVDPATPEDLKLAASCGRWGPTRPGELFLRAYHDVLTCLEADPMAGVVSPPLMGSYGSIPLTIIAPLVDIARHMSNLIVRAQKEVFFATCSWSPSDAVRLVTDALRELSRRAGERGEKVVVKIISDKASLSQIVHHHQALKPDVYAGGKIRLPRPEEVPHLDMEVASLHHPLLGTLHSKFMVIDRKIGIVESNNMEDNANMEMMTQLEGPIVDSLYDCSLVTWNDGLKPPLPTRNSPAHEQPVEDSPAERQHPAPMAIPQPEVAQVAPGQLPPNNPGDPHYDDSPTAEIARVQAMYAPRGGESQVAAINRHLNETSKSNATPTAPELEGDPFLPYITHHTEPFPMAMVSRRPFGAPQNSDGFVPQNEAFLSLIRNAKASIFIQTPDLNAKPLLPALTAAIKRGVEVTYYVCLGYNDAGEMIPGQGGTNETFATQLYEQLRGDERKLLNVHWYTAKDQIRPIHEQFKQRACHIKLLIADGHVGVQGSGNQDTQSWFHSQEVNVMIDSETTCREWREGIDRNQNTLKYGQGSREDGRWRDKHGNLAEGSTPEYHAPVSWVKGVVGMAKKLEEKGGF